MSTRVPLTQDFACVLAIRAAQDLHQRRFAGAVFAEQDVDFAGVERQVDAVERDDAGKRFPDAAHLEDGRLGPRRRHEDRNLEQVGPAGAGIRRACRATGRRRGPGT